MDLVDFTTFDDIRAALGVGQAEIKDATLSLKLYANNLSSEFSLIAEDLVDVFQALPDELTQTTAQKAFARYTQLFATYAVAKQLTVSLPLFSPKEIGDGKAHMTRYAVDPYKSTIKGVTEQYDMSKAQLSAAYAALSSSVATAVPTRPYFTRVSPASDPVTGT